MRFVTLLCLSLACWSSGPPPSPTVGNPAPAIESVQLGGAPFSLSALSGKPAVLVFWSSWCGPCKAEIPHIASLTEQYSGRVAFVSINAGESPPTAARAAEAWGITWPVVFDPDARIQADYQVEGIPLTVIVDAEGVVRSRELGLPENTEAVLDGLL